MVSANTLVKSNTYCDSSHAVVAVADAAAGPGTTPKTAKAKSWKNKTVFVRGKGEKSWSAKGYTTTQRQLQHKPPTTTVKNKLLANLLDRGGVGDGQARQVDQTLRSIERWCSEGKGRKRLFDMTYQHCPRHRNIIEMRRKSTFFRLNNNLHCNNWTTQQRVKKMVNHSTPKTHLSFLNMPGLAPASPCCW